MKKIKLSNRLQSIADFIDPCNSVLDIGTDHAYLPLYLISQNVCKTVLATDVNDAPLKKARKNIQLYEADDRIDLVKSDGLKNIDISLLDPAYVVIAGMGGELIIEIMMDSIVESRGITWILQPMTKPEKLRRWLWDNGFVILMENIVSNNSIFLNLM